METCKDCIHYSACYVALNSDAAMPRGKSCLLYKDKSQYEKVVRCKDCAYANEEGTVCRYSVGKSTKPNRYCSEGECRDE